MIFLFFFIPQNASKFESEANFSSTNNDISDINDSIITGIRDLGQNSYFTVSVFLKENKAIKWKYKCDPEHFQITLLIMSSNDYTFFPSYLHMLGLKKTIDFWDQCIVSVSSRDSGKYHDSSDRYYFVFVYITGSGSVEYEINPNVKYIDWGNIGLVIFWIFIIFFKFVFLILKSLFKRKSSTKTQLNMLNNSQNDLN
ncbi:MAG: hypothetical protein ACFFG0_23440 [Candidatus Thorarchaeota archaeon]